MWRYYVYELIDPRDSAVFYVGKGTGDRIDQHEREAAKGVSSKKCNKIRKITNAGLRIGKRKIAYFKDESDAYEFEDKRIAEYGKENLCNVAPLMNEEKATTNDYLSFDFMRLMAIGFRSEAGFVNDYTGRPWAAALHRAFMRRFDKFVRVALREIGFDELRDGVARFGITLTDGR